MEETLASLKEGFTTATAENNAVSVVQEGKEDEDVGDFGTPAELATDVEVEKLNKTMDESFKGLGEEPILPTSPLEKERFKDELSGSGASVSHDAGPSDILNSKVLLGADAKDESGIEQTSAVLSDVSTFSKPNALHVTETDSTSTLKEESVATEVTSKPVATSNETEPGNSIAGAITELDQNKNEENPAAGSHIESKKEATKALETTTDFGQDIFGMTEEEALAFLKEEEDAKKARASAGPPKIEIYGSSVSGNMKIKKAQNKIIDTLERFKIEYTFVDLAADDQAKLYIKRKNPNSTNIPQIYINGEFSMEFAEFEELLEYDELFEALGVEPDF